MPLLAVYHFCTNMGTRAVSSAPADVWWDQPETLGHAALEAAGGPWRPLERVPGYDGQAPA
jgi:hypothetical protein